MSGGYIIPPILMANWDLIAQASEPQYQLAQWLGRPRRVRPHITSHYT